MRHALSPPVVTSMHGKLSCDRWGAEHSGQEGTAGVVTGGCDLFPGVPVQERGHSPH